MLELKVHIKGKTTGDLELALVEVVKKVSEGYLVGTDSNDDGHYSFAVTGKKGNTLGYSEAIIPPINIKGK